MSLQDQLFYISAPIFIGVERFRAITSYCPTLSDSDDYFILLLYRSKFIQQKYTNAALRLLLTAEKKVKAVIPSGHCPPENGSQDACRF